MFPRLSDSRRREYASPTVTSIDSPLIRRTMCEKLLADAQLLISRLLHDRSAAEFLVTTGEISRASTLGQQYDSPFTMNVKSSADAEAMFAKPLQERESWRFPDIQRMKSWESQFFDMTMARTRITRR
jgi:hypothetical protein